MSAADLHLSPGAQLRAHALRPKKSWGQNFLTDPEVHRAVIEAARLPAATTVVELGAGLGALTAHLVAEPRVARVIAVERDPDLVTVLRQRFADVDRVEVVAADAARLNWGDWYRRHGPLAVVGNLPYHLACRIAVDLAAVAHVLVGVGLLVQREVALRLAAPPGNGRGLLSVLVQRGFDVQLGREVPPQAFVPSPKVQSSVVSLRPRPQATTDAAVEAAGRWVARTAFAGRRKTLLNTLSRGCGVDKPELAAQLLAAGIDPGLRPEALPTAAFYALGATLLARGLLPAAAAAPEDPP